MVVVGLDPGSLCTGYGLIAVDGGRLHCLGCGRLRPPRAAPLSARLLALFDGASALLRERRPDAVALEEAFIGRHARPALVLGHARGALIVAALSLRIPVYEYAPRQVKLAVTGVGGASKQQVQRMVRRLVGGLNGELSLDETDALAVAVCHAHRARIPTAGGRAT